ncbi:MAG TPA: hypothetical protein VF427_02970 [Noviherbaspirillum sp.]
MYRQLIHRPNTSHIRQELMALLTQAPFKTDYDLDCKAMQHRTYEQLGVLNRWAGSGSALLRDRDRLFSALEFAAIVNPSLFHVAQVHYGVCLASIKELGNHSTHLQKVIDSLDELASVCAILITELGRGNSHLAIATRAVYEPKTEQFVISTPDKAARKIMPNVALEGVAKMGLVFAQLWCGDKNHGLFPFVVPIRSERRIFPGIHITPLPGNSALSMDYAMVHFDEVRVPRANWLGDTATINKDAMLVDPLADISRRLVRSLVGSGNASTSTAIGAAAVSRVCTWTALRYAVQRNTMGQLGPRRSVLEFRSQQNLLFSALAETYAITCLANQLVADSQASNVTGAASSTGPMTAPWATINRLAALTKTVAIGGAEAVILNCRRASGAQGVLAVNRFREYEDLVVAYASAGGDNRLILLDIGCDLARRSGDGSLPSVSLPSEFGGADALRQLAKFEERRQYERVTKGLAECQAGDKESLPIWNPRLTAAIDLAKIYGCRVALERLLESAREMGENGKVVEALATIYAINHFGACLPYETSDRALTCAFDVVLPQLDRLLDAFDLSPIMVSAPMASGDYTAM